MRLEEGTGSEMSQFLQIVNQKELQPLADALGDGSDWLNSDGELPSNMSPIIHSMPTFSQEEPANHSRTVRQYAEMVQYKDKLSFSVIIDSRL
jgi:hypothetical protein